MGRRKREPGFRTAVEQLEPRRMLSAQAVPQSAFTTVVLANSLGGTAAVAGSSSPPSAAFSPSTILNAYGFNQVTFSNGTVQGNGAGQTIALVDAYNDPNITTDLAAFDSQFGIAAPPSFKVEGENGSSQLPSNPTPSTNTNTDANDWSLEISLDVEWAHALAPDANILLVEASTSNLSDLFASAQTAAATSGVVAVSMSFGGSEYSAETGNDSSFVTPSGHLGGSATVGGTEIAGGVTFIAAAGDQGSPGYYPAYSPNVVAVGGTSLTLSSGNYSSETAWADTGGGISQYEAEPSYQQGVVPSSDSNGGANRAIPDVAFDANPNTGVAVVDSYDYYSGDSFGSSGSWVQVGGTSFGSPAWAAIVAIADQGRAIDGLGSLNGATQTLPELYSMPASDFHDITSGSNGTYSAATGYDLVTGRGTPIVSSVVGTFVNFTVASTTPAVGSTDYQTAPTSFTVTFSDAYSTTGLSASDFKVNGVSATSFSDTSSTSITFTFSSSPVLTNQPTQTMTITAGTIDRSADGSPIQAFSGTFNYDPMAQITVASTTPAAGSTVLLPMTSLTVQFNEAYRSSSIGTSNLSLSQGTVTGYTLVNSTTVTYSLSGLTSAGSLTVKIAAGAILDADGGAGAAFSASYLLSTGFTAELPVGSLAYESETGGDIASQGATDVYSVNIAAGQTITVIVDPTNTNGLPLSGSQISLSGPGISGSDVATATSHNQALLQTIPASGGTYTFTVSSYLNKTGNFTLIVLLNSAVSTSAIGSTSNNSLTTAQNISGSLGTNGTSGDGSFEPIGPTAMRGAVLGVSDALNNGQLSDYYSFYLAAGQSVTLAVADQSDSAGTVNVSLLNSNGTLATGKSLTTNVDGAVENYVVTTSGTYYADVTSTHSNVEYELVVTAGADFDLKGNSTETSAQNITGTAGVLGAIVSGATTDWYAVTLSAGAALNLQTYTFGSTASAQFTDSLQPNIQLYNPSGTLIASGSGSPNQSIAATATVSGTYYIEVTGNSSSTGEYFLGVSELPSVAITPISPNPTNAAVSSMQIVFNGPVSGMSLSDLSLSLGGGPNLLTSSQTLTTTNDTTFTLGNLASLTAANGVYTLSVAANSGIKNQNGLALQTGASSTFTVDSDPPEVEGVYVSGTAWTSYFLNYLVAKGLGAAQLGYLVPAGSGQLNDLPWVNINTISVTFNENVSVNTADSMLELIGSSSLPAAPALSGATFTYSSSSSTYTAQWTFASPLATDKYLLNIPSADVTDALGSTLDGEWTNSSSAYPSGNGVAGGNFDFQFNVLQGDINQTGTVAASYSSAVRAQLLQNTTTSGYSLFYDLNGAGSITGVDGTYVRLNLGSTLPSGNPSPPGGSGVVVAASPSAAVGSGSDSGASSDGGSALTVTSSATSPSDGSTTDSQLLALGNSGGNDSISLGPTFWGDSTAPLGPSALKLASSTPVVSNPATPQPVSDPTAGDSSPIGPIPVAPSPVAPSPVAPIAVVPSPIVSGSASPNAPLMYVAMMPPALPSVPSLAAEETGAAFNTDAAPRFAGENAPSQLAAETIAAAAPDAFTAIEPRGDSSAAGNGEYIGDPDDDGAAVANAGAQSNAGLPVDQIADSTNAPNTVVQPAGDSTRDGGDQPVDRLTVDRLTVEQFTVEQFTVEQWLTDLVIEQELDWLIGE